MFWGGLGLGLVRCWNFLSALSLRTSCFLVMLCLVFSSAAAWEDFVCSLILGLLDTSVSSCSIPYFYNQVVLIDVPSLQLGRYSLQEEQGDSEAIIW